MVLTRRHWLTIIPVVLYWPVIFTLTHIPIPRMIIKNIPTSDKTLHYLAYLVLVFLLWFAVGSDKKVNWRKAQVWWVLVVVVVYGAIDEWLQGYVGRNPDTRDFFADILGTFTGLFLLSIFPFWSVSLVVTGAAIFVSTNLIQANIDTLPPLTNAVFHLFAYALFSLLWTQYMHSLLPVRAPQFKWLIGALVFPTGFLAGVEFFSALAGDNFVRLQDVIISILGIAIVVTVIFLTALLRQGYTKKV